MILEQIFGSRTRAKLLRIFLANPDRAYFVRELTRKIDERINSVRRELENLENLGIIKFVSKNRKKYFQVNKDFVLYPELKGLIMKAQVALEKSIAKKLKKIGQVSLLVLTGIFTGVKDITQTDVLIVGRINRRSLKRMMNDFQKNFDQELNYTMMSSQEYKYRHDLTDRFLYGILENPKVVLIDKVKK